MEVLFHNLKQEQEINYKKKKTLKINFHASILRSLYFLLFHGYSGGKKAAITEPSHLGSPTHYSTKCFIFFLDHFYM